MHHHSLFSKIRTGGILQWSTACILASLVSCDSNERKAPTAQDFEMHNLQTKLDKIEAEKSRLQNGEVANNFEIPGLGFYHAEAHDFFPYKFGEFKDNQWYVNGQWQSFDPGEAHVSASKPSPEALKRVELALEQEQKSLEQGNQLATQSSGSTQHVYHHSSGFGNAMMMYWLLSGNRNSYTPTSPGFANAQANSQSWSNQYQQQRQAVSSYAATSPTYSRVSSSSPSGSNRTSSSFSSSSSSRSSSSAPSSTSSSSSSSRGGFGSFGGGHSSSSSS